MEHGLSVTSLLIVILAAFLTPIILHKLKLNMIPVVVAEILVGLIIGNSGFNIVESDMWLETLSTLGFIYIPNLKVAGQLKMFFPLWFPNLAMREWKSAKVTRQ